MQVAETVPLLLLSAFVCLCASAVEHHTRHSVPKYLTPCPHSCQCIIIDHYTETVDIVCKNRPSNGIKLPPSVTSLVFENVSTLFLQSSNLVPTSSSGSEMIKVVYTQSEIKGISQHTFSKLPYLEHLDLSRNFISEIPLLAFSPLSRLRVLDLSNNYLSTLPNDMLENQLSLRELYISKNQLEAMLTETYANCSELQVLDFSHNRILDISEDVKLSSSLITLLLNNNKLKSVPIQMFTNLENLEILDLANNEIQFISDQLFHKLKSLEKLDLQGNRIAEIPTDSFKELIHLQVLNISKNPIENLDDKMLQSNLELNTLSFSETLINKINARLLAKLKRLRVLDASHNYHLETIEDFKISSSNHLQFIDLRNGNLTSLPIFISHLQVVEQLRIEGNPWKCDCRSGWFIEWLQNHEHSVNTTLTCDGSENLLDKLISLNCEPPQAINDTTTEVLEFRSSAMLTCLFNGEPIPSITWVTPSGYIFHYYPKNATDIFSSHPRIHLYDLEPIVESRIQVMSNGSLHIQEIHRQDAGIYTCIAINPVGNSTSHIVVTLDRETFFHIKLMCIIVGASCVIAVLLCTAIGQIIYWICKKCGLVEERGKQLIQLRENIETYKSQQLESLRQNYTQQVHRIKENCTQQVEWIRDSYQSQVKHLKDFKHYGSHQFSSMRDQYYDQMKKVRDYSTSQLGWVRENYVFQRNRVQKFSSHQVLRFRESYKYQQQTLNKILENLPNLHLDNCRGSSCGRSETSMFTDPKEDFHEELVDIQDISEYVKTELEQLTDPAVLDEGIDAQSVYYTPSELSDGPQSPVKEMLLRRQLQYSITPEAYSPDNPLDRPSTSYSTVPWLPDSPCHVFHSSQSGIQVPQGDEEFQVPRTLQSSTSLPEMPQLCDDDKMFPSVPATSHETAL
ncbi:leucine-rich repeat neuronal protein 1-like [Macrosteles quadrilineatus]|uniref:leucine-rich repeat neuronal protein 1-like n=1 Tax=Macrosteles quadrilineatus TaxID=74068 RepID=UPI0023E09959|nr:leucine-rich repeat neuronal protein 1-like [Macrosteles quadrilineatus]